MRILIKLSKTTLVNSIYQPKSHFQFHSLLKPLEPNRSLNNYLKSNKTFKVLLLFRKWLSERPTSLDSYSFLFAIKACTRKPFSFEGQQFHTQIIKFGFQFIIQLQTSLLTFYSNIGNLVDAHNLFDEIPERNVVCWTALICGYVKNQRPNEALDLFRQMEMENVEPDQMTLTVVLSACADQGALEMGEQIHDYIRRTKGFKLDLTLMNALIDMYAKCGKIEIARTLFDSCRRKDVTSWTSMIFGHAQHGQAKEAIELFANMKETNKKPNNNCGLIIPNDVTFIGVLMACCHAGMVEEGKNYFESMVKDYNLKPRESHYGCIVDLFCRAGFLQEAYDFILKISFEANAVMWRMLLSACSVHGNIGIAGKVRKKLSELEPSYVGDHVAMSNIYAAKGMWNQKFILRNRIKKRKTPGHSLIQIKK